MILLLERERFLKYLKMNKIIISKMKITKIK